MMSTTNDTLERLDHWLDDGRDGAADAPAPAALSEPLAARDDLAAEERALRRLFAQLESARIDVAPDFADRVMASLPRRRPLVAWGIAAAVLLALGLGAVSLLAAAGIGGESLGLVAALGDFAATSLAAGAGLLGATWSGVGSAVREWLGPSPVNWVVAASVMLALCLLLASLVRRRAPAVAARRSARRDDGS